MRQLGLAQNRANSAASSANYFRVGWRDKYAESETSNLGFASKRANGFAEISAKHQGRQLAWKKLEARTPLSKLLAPLYALMCGIAAIFNYRTGQPVARDEMQRMLTHMQRRGPDGSGEWYGLQGAVSLGHRRLSIIDLSDTGAQPMISANGKNIVTFNGEIYNYRELRAELEAKGRKFRSHSDTEVLLHLYEMEGEGMLQKLRGMYAFAIWDDDRRGMFLARDPFGIKPLYYADNGQTFRAASQVKALIAGGMIDSTPEAAGHVGFFLWGHVPAPYTLYKQIRAVPAGCSLWVDADGAGSPKTFFSVPQTLARAEAEADGPKTHAEPREIVTDQLRSALQDSVRQHLIADVPVGVFLSAGLDSTTIAALAAETSVTLRTVTLGFEEFRGTPSDESPLAERVAAQYGAQHQTIWVRKQDFRDNFGRLMAAMDQPSCDGINSFFISHAAATAGLKVALSGLGGDELFGSYPSFQQVPRVVGKLQPFRNWHRANRAFRWVSAPLLERFTSPKYAGLLEYGGTYGGAYLLRRGMFMPWELPSILDPDLVREGWEELQTLARLEETTEQINSPHLRIAALEMTWYMRHQLLRDTDWASMDHSLEVRTPFVDCELLRKIAPLLLAQPRPDKQAMARTPSRPLPDEVLNRSKTGFSVPVREWLVQEDSDFRAERGLRGWTRLVYSSFLADRRGSLHLTRAAMGRRPGSPAIPARASRKVLVFRIGQLGDTIAALPALWAVRNHFRDAELTLLCDRHPGKPHVFGPDLLQDSGLFKRFEFYPVRDGTIGRAWQIRDMFKLLGRLRQERFDTLVYLSPSARSRRQIARDIRFFRLAGISNFIGTDGFASAPNRTAGQPLDEVPHEAELLLARMAASHVPVPASGLGCMDLRLGAKEESEVAAWLQGEESRRKKADSRKPKAQTGKGRGNDEEKSDRDNRPWIGFGPGTKMPSKRWPIDRFAEVGSRLIQDLDIWPVVFGGVEDAEDAEQLLRTWGRGYNAAGKLSVRAAAAALKHCELYVGNDTGTMHLAASVDTKCVAIFSARDWPGRWYPYGKGHRVFRSQIECEGCGLVECIERRNECLNRISVDEVLAGCKAVLQAPSSLILAPRS